MKQYFRIGIIALSMGLSVSTMVHGNTEKDIDGIWLGTLKVPGAELRIALTISKSDVGKYAVSMNSIDQGSGELPLDEVKYENHLLFIKSPKIGIEFEGQVNVDQKTFDCEFRQGPGKFPILFHKVEKLPILSRPQEPKRPFPYHEEQVEYENKSASITIAGTLTYPKTYGPFPAVILLNGSGPQDRDSDVFGHKLFLVLSDYLTRPIAASKSSDVSFVVMVAGVGIHFDDIILFQKELKWKKAGMNKEDLKLHCTWHHNVSEIVTKDTNDDEAADEIRVLYSRLSTEEQSRLNKTPESLEGEIKWVLDPWRRYASKYNAASIISKVQCPVLAINGSKDMQVEASKNLKGIEKALKAGGNTSYTIKELKGLNHLLQTADTGDESEYTTIEETISPYAMKIIADWIKEQVVKM